MQNMLLGLHSCHRRSFWIVCSLDASFFQFILISMELLQLLRSLLLSKGLLVRSEKYEDLFGQIFIKLQHEEFMEAQTQSSIWDKLNIIVFVDYALHAPYFR